MRRIGSMTPSIFSMLRFKLFILPALVASSMLLLCCQADVQYTTAALADQIDSSTLPGADALTINFNQFSGYLDVSGRKHMHYWFVESENMPETDPLAFWTNGGPGCSGLIGFMTEQGPFRPNADLTLTMNQFAWNKKANMVFMEAPVGVGYSYSDDTDDYKTGDLKTAADNYAMIQAFFDRFPHLRQNDLHLSSESYGGHYIPTLAKHIVMENEHAKGTLKWLNLKGIAIGNPYTDPYSGLPAMIDTFWGHQVISRGSYEKYLSTCDVESDDFINGDDNYEMDKGRHLNFADTGNTCLKSLMTVIRESGSLNPYALDYRICSREEGKLREMATKQRAVFLNSLLKVDAESSLSRRLNINEYVPCTPDYATAYLNQNSVKNAIHVNQNIVWGECSDPVWKGYNKTDSRIISTAPIYNYLIESNHNLKILVFSGDDDAVCGTIGTQKWIWNLGYPNTKKMWAEYMHNDQLAGYHTTWDNTNLTFLTIHNAGHEVPAYKPSVALDMWNTYLDGGWW